MSSQISSHILHTHEHTPTLTLPHPVSGSSNSIPSDLLILQVNAFLEAAEDVEVDPETIQELVQLISDKRELPDVVDEPGLESEGNEWLSGEEHLDEDLDISALFADVNDGTRNL